MESPGRIRGHILHWDLLTKEMKGPFQEDIIEKPTWVLGSCICLAARGPLQIINFRNEVL